MNIVDPPKISIIIIISGYEAGLIEYGYSKTSIPFLEAFRLNGSKQCGGNWINKDLNFTSSETLWTVLRSFGWIILDARSKNMVMILHHFCLIPNAVKQ